MILRLGDNPIRAEGISHLVKAAWPMLEQIIMHDIGGLQYLSKCNFPYLNKLVIGTYNFT